MKSKLNYNRTVFGSVVKAKDPAQSMYVKVRLQPEEYIVLRDGDYIQVETPTWQLKNLDVLVEKGLLNPDKAEKEKERIQTGITNRKAKSSDGQTDFVVADLVFSTRNS